MNVYEKFAPVLYDLGYDVTPVVGKKPILPGWQQRPNTALNFADHSDKSIGVLLGGKHNLVAVDVDVLTPLCANEIKTLIENEIGYAPERIGLAPKFLMVFRCTESWRKRKTGIYEIEGKNCAIELLGEGQQFVASGIHEDTKKKYFWPGDSLIDIPPQDLTEVTPEALCRFLAHASSIMGTYGPLKGRVSDRPSQPRGGLNLIDLTAPVIDIRPALEHVPNNDEHYDDWVQTAHAIKGALGDDGYDLFCKWSARSDKDDIAQNERLWRSIGTVTSVGAGSIFHWASEHGFDLAETRNAIKRADQRAQGDAGGEDEDFEKTLDDAIERLALLSPLQYDVRRKQEAKQLGVRVSVLDSAVTTARAGEDDGGFKLYEPEPWDEEVDGDDLLDRVVAAIRQYVIMPEHVAETAALWVVHTHAFDWWQVTPRLAISAPTMGSGKTVMLDVLSAMVPRALEAANLSTAVAFRAIDKFRPTFMIDEVDTFLRDNDELRGVLNSGHRKGGQALRCEGDNNELKAFPTFAPVATAGIGALPGTLADRSIRVELQRKKPDEHVVGFRSDRIDHLRILARQMARWVDDNEEVLRSAEPAMPTSMHNRKADNWRPLLSIADAAGGDWPERARAAAIALSKTDDAESQKVQLLADIQAIFAEYFEDRMPSKKLVERLHELEDRPWSDFRRGNRLTTQQLGGMLRSFRIVSSTMRFSDGHNAKGYKLSDFQDVFSRYLGDSAVTPSQVNDTAGYSDSSAVTNTSGVTAENVENSRVSAGCDGVTAKKGGNGTPHENNDEDWSTDL